MCALRVFDSVVHCFILLHCSHGTFRILIVCWNLSISRSLDAYLVGTFTLSDISGHIMRAEEWNRREKRKSEMQKTPFVARHGDNQNENIILRFVIASTTATAATTTTTTRKSVLIVGNDYIFYMVVIIFHYIISIFIRSLCVCNHQQQWLQQCRQSRCSSNRFNVMTKSDSYPVVLAYSNETENRNKLGREKKQYVRRRRRPWTAQRV